MESVNVIVTTPNSVFRCETSKPASFVLEVMKLNGFEDRVFESYIDDFGNTFYFAENIEICVCTPSSFSE